MLEPLFGDVTTRILYYLYSRKDGYAREIAAQTNLAPSAVQKQLTHLEDDAGVLVSNLRGNVRLFTWNPRYPFLKELRALIKRGMDYLPADERDMYMARLRPRRPGKPL